MPDSSSNPLAASPQVILRERFGLQSFRKGQEQILDSILGGRDTLAIMPTGSGKSLCYQLPALLREGVVVVVSPLISLMKDQVGSLRELGIPAGCIHSGQSAADKKAVFAQLERSPSFILYLSPERVQKPGFARWVKNRKISLFAIDEAHCISQWGHDFRPDYSALSLLREICPQVPMLLLTATATPLVVSDISREVGLRRPARHIHGFYRPNLFIQVMSARNEQSKLEAVRLALRQTPEGRVIVYCGTRRVCEELAAQLAPDFPATAYYHAGLAPEERTRIQEDYDRGVVRILLATNAFGMGIDHPDVRLVVHYQITANLESYYQEIGRAGRDGRESTCLLLYARKDKGLQSFFIRESEAPPQVIRHRWENLDAMIQFAEGGECRHGEILAYFRDEQKIDRCGHCDSCAAESPRAVPKPAGVRKSARKSRRGGSDPGDTPPQGPILDPTAQELMEALRAWRREFASQQEMPAFLVFSDKTLKDICVKFPRTHRELLEVNGFGEHKVDRFGTEVLAVIAAQSEAHSPPPGPVDPSF